jgi:uncharacterized membrane protein
LGAANPVGEELAQRGVHQGLPKERWSADVLRGSSATITTRPPGGGVQRPGLCSDRPEEPTITPPAEPDERIPEPSAGLAPGAETPEGSASEVGGLADALSEEPVPSRLAADATPSEPSPLEPALTASAEVSTAPALATPHLHHEPLGRAAARFAGLTFDLALLGFIPLVVTLALTGLIQNPSCRGLLLPQARWDVLHQTLRRNEFALWPIAVGALAAPFAVAFVRAAVGTPFGTALRRSARGLLWVLIPAGHTIVFFLRPRDLGLDPELWERFLETWATPLALIWSLGPAGWLATSFGGRREPVPAASVDGTGPPEPVAAAGWSPAFSVTMVSLAALAFAGVFGTLGVLQSRALLVPHGDSGMYEEHLWNLTHGKGFRSQIDEGRLFLGERFQFLHLALVPVHWLAPSLETLIIAQAAVVAAGAIPLWLLGRRMGLGTGLATALAISHLLYFPAHYLLLETSTKAFRPNPLALPVMFAALLALESGRYGRMIVLLAIALTAGEDYALQGVALGFVLMLKAGWRNPLGSLRGLMLSVGSAVALAVILGVIIPWFRDGQPPHYSPYFKSLGNSPAEIVRSALTNPLPLVGRIANLKSLQFLLLMTGPLLLLPWLSPGRMLVAAPTFAFLLLGEREGMQTPFFHFHAPLVPVLFWATAGSLARIERLSPRLGNLLARLLPTMALASAFWVGESPLSLRFHDPLLVHPMKSVRGVVGFEPTGGTWWGVRFRPGPRRDALELAAELIPETDRVAATDYIRNRFTHHAAAHVWPELRSHVSIDDMDAIVLDKTEMWWGRGDPGNPTDPQRELTVGMAMTEQLVPGITIKVHGLPWRVVYHDPWILALRRVRAGAVEPGERPVAAPGS